MTPQINHLGKTSTVLRVSTHIYGDHLIDVLRKHIYGFHLFILRVNLRHVTPQIDHLRKKLCFKHVLRVSTCDPSFMGGDRWKNIHLSGKPRHVTPQIDCLGKTSTVLRVSTHIYGVSKEIDGKMFIFRVNLGM